MPANQGAGAGSLDAAEVRAMFDRIAGVYDLLNGAMTAGLHHRWRSLAAAETRLRPGALALDVATGTGDLALELAKLVVPGGEVIGADFSEQMLARARSKSEQAGVAAVRFESADAMNLPYEDDRFDAATVGFGARNFSDRVKGLAEMSRVVKPGGRVVVLEITTPRRLPLSAFYALWFDRVVPLLGRLTGLLNSQSKIADAYTYLPNSVKRFPAPEALAAEMASVGLGEIRWRLTAGGIIAIHAATVLP